MLQGGGRVEYGGGGSLMNRRRGRREAFLGGRGGGSPAGIHPTEGRGWPPGDLGDTNQPDQNGPGVAPPQEGG